MSTARQLALLDVSAASGLVAHGDELCVIADDELALRRYTLDGQPLARCRLLRGTLPADVKQRKKHKPDFESLVRLPDGSLLALGSGSRKRRHRGVRVAPGFGKVRGVDLAPLYRALETHFETTLNVEGAAFGADALVLAHRGAGGARSALVFLDRARVLSDLGNDVITADCVRRVAPIVLGKLRGIRLALTDLAFDGEGRLHFSAVAEDSDNAYDDGGCAGSVVGRFDRALKARTVHRLPAPLKIEGLAFDAPRRRWLLVADADEPSIFSPLLALPATS